MRYIGLDLAWGERARTGLAVLDPEGRLVWSASVVTDDEIARHLGDVGDTDGVVSAIDAPLVVVNETGQRACEREVGRDFGRYSAGAYPANRGNAAFNPEPRGARLARRSVRVSRSGRPSLAGGGSVAIEVYPHPAMVSLFRTGPRHPLQGQERARRGCSPGRVRLVVLVHGCDLRAIAPPRGSLPSAGRRCRSRCAAHLGRSISTASRTRWTPSSVRISPGCGPTRRIR